MTHPESLTHPVLMTTVAALKIRPVVVIFDPVSFTDTRSPSQAPPLVFLCPFSRSVVVHALGGGE